MDINKINEIVKEVIVNNDPISLIKMGAPNDEYNLEIGEIAYRLSTNGTKNIKKTVEDVFLEKFDSETVKDTQNKLELVAKEIEQKLRQ